MAELVQAIHVVRRSECSWARQGRKLCACKILLRAAPCRPRLWSVAGVDSRACPRACPGHDDHGRRPTANAV